MPELESVPQRPMRILARGLELGLASFPRLIALTTLLGFAGFSPTIYLAVQVGTAKLTPDFMVQLLKQWHFLANMLVLQLLVLVLSSLISALIIQRLDNAAHDTQGSHELSSALRKMPSLILAGILCFLTLLIGMLVAGLIGAILGAIFGIIFGHIAALTVTKACIFIALIYIVVNLLFFQFSIIMDNKGAVAALNHSCTLVFGNWWRTFLVLLCVALIVFGIVIVIALPFATLMPSEHGLSALSTLDTGKTLLIKGVAKLTGVALLTPFILGVVYRLYLDLRARHALRSASLGTIQA
jgi:hypothetical protein